MTPLKEIGECLVSTGDTDYFFRPSFANMTHIGEPQEVVKTFYDLHNDESPDLIKRAVAAYGCVPAWLIAHLNRPQAGKRALMAAVTVLQACCDRDVSPLAGELVPGKTGKWGFVWKRGTMPVGDIILIAQSLITHGIIGKAKVRQLQRNETGQTTTEFHAVEYINAARHHFGMTRGEAENLTMTEFVLLLNAKYPQQKGFTKEEYESVTDEFLKRQQRRRERGKRKRAA
jgi:hypothetical protein